MSKLTHSWTKEPKDMTTKERVAWMGSMEALWAIENDIHDTLNQAEMIPNDWHLIWQDTGERGETQRVTIRLDRDVVRFFKAMGPGYQTRMNRVLRAFMLTRLARIVDGPEDAAR